MNDETVKLADLRSKIIADLQPLVESADMIPEQKFDILLAAAKSSGSSDGYEKAYTQVKQIQAPEDQVNAYLDLLEAIDLADGDIDLSQPTTDTTTEAQDQNLDEPDQPATNVPAATDS